MRTCPPRCSRAQCSSSTGLCPSSTCGNEGKEKAQQPLGITELLSVEAAGIEPVNKAMENPKQDALLPAIALILLGFVLPPLPTPRRPLVFRPFPRWRGTLRAQAPRPPACAPPHAGRCATGGPLLNVQLAPAP